MRIHILAFLLFFQCLAACQQGPEKVWPSATNIVFQSVDGGQTWQDVSAGLPEGLEVGSVFAGGGEVFLGSESGLYRSTNPLAAGAWEVSLDNKITDIFPGRAGPYACSYGSGFFQEMSGTGIWVPMHNTLKDKTIHTVLEAQDSTVFVCCDSGIFKSADSGKTWKQVFAEGMVMSLVAADGVLVGGGFRGVLRSTDGGEHWDWVLTEDGAALRTGLIDGGVAVITYDGWTQQLRTSADNGKTWQRIDGERLPPVRFLCDIKQAGEYLFCSQDAGIFRSSDQGKTWELVFPSRGSKVFNLAVSGQLIFAVMLIGC